MPGTVLGRGTTKVNNKMFFTQGADSLEWEVRLQRN